MVRPRTVTINIVLHALDSKQSDASSKESLPFSSSLWGEGSLVSLSFSLRGGESASVFYKIWGRLLPVLDKNNERVRERKGWSSTERERDWDRVLSSFVSLKLGTKYKVITATAPNWGHIIRIISNETNACHRYKFDFDKSFRLISFSIQVGLLIILFELFLHLLFFIKWHLKIAHVQCERDL